MAGSIATRADPRQRTRDSRGGFGIRFTGRMVPELGAQAHCARVSRGEIVTTGILSGPTFPTPGQARLWRKRLIFAFLGVLSFAAVAELVTSIDDRCETKTPYLADPSDGFVGDPSGDFVGDPSGRTFECRPSEGWKVRLSEYVPYYIS